MERQFAQAQILVSSKHECRGQSKHDPREPKDLIDRPDTSPFSTLSGPITTYVADEDKRRLNAPDVRVNFTPIISAGISHSPQTQNVPKILSHPDPIDSTGPLNVTERQPLSCDPAITQSVSEIRMTAFSTGMQGNSWWWDRDPEALGEVFGESFFFPEISF